MGFGGYQIIDFGNFNFKSGNATNTTIEGLWSKLKSTSDASNKKPILLINLIVNGRYKRNEWAYLGNEAVGENTLTTMSGLTFDVDSTDYISMR